MPSKKEYARNRDKYRKKSLDYYLAHRKERDYINKIWKENNPEKLKAINLRYIEKNKEIIKQKAKNYGKKHKIERSEYRKEWIKNNPEKQKDRKLRWNYGITYENYLKILKDQDNRCGVCRIEFKNIYKYPDLRSTCIDHVHSETKEVRGVLCRACNSGIGLFEDNPSLLKNALQWITKIEYDVLFDKGWFQKRSGKLLYEKIFEEQNGKCGICQKNLREIKTNLDHNHVSMKIRGLLCLKCNKALGFLKDDLIIIKNSIFWLNKETKERM